MKRIELEARAIQDLKLQGWECERAPNQSKRIPIKKGNKIIRWQYVAIKHDYFNIFDLIAVKDNIIRFIQVTSEDISKSTAPNWSLRQHMHKIEKHWNVKIPVELFFYKKLKNRWALSQYVYEDNNWFVVNLDSLNGSIYPDIKTPMKLTKAYINASEVVNE